MLQTFVAYDVDRNLGAAYNRAMERLCPSDWACFLDHDAIFTCRGWYPLLLKAIEENPRGGLFTACTNRVGRTQQIAQGCPTGHDMREHFAFGRKLAEEHGASVYDISESPISGVMMAISHETWEQIGGFTDGFFGVDNRVHRDVRKTGKRVYMVRGLYVYHWYRADGVGHSGAPKAATRG